MTDVVTDVSTSAVIRVYSGTRPATVGTVLSSNTLLAQLTGNASQFGTVSSGVLTVSAITDDSSADASGTPTFARVFKSDGTTAVFDCSAGVGSGDLNFATALTAGQVVSITSWTLTEGNA
jgi:hypothetical protein